MQKYEREIADLLEKLETQAPPPPRPLRRDRPPQLPRRRSPVIPGLRQFAALGSGQLMTTGLGLVILSWLLPDGLVKQLLVVLGVALFLWPIAVNLLGRNGGNRSEKTWRGRPVEPTPADWGEFRHRIEGSARDWRRRFRRRP